MKPIEDQFGYKNLCDCCINDKRSFYCTRGTAGGLRTWVNEPCHQSDWEKCPHNKPEPVKEWKWTIRPYNGPQATTDRYYTDEEIEDFAMLNGRHVGYLCIKDSERIRA